MKAEAFVKVLSVGGESACVRDSGSPRGISTHVWISGASLLLSAQFHKGRLTITHSDLLPDLFTIDSSSP